MSQKVLIEFYDTQNNKIRDKLHVPLSITRKHLLSLLNQSTPLNLYLNDQEILNTLQEVCDTQDICLEQILKIYILPSTDTLPIQTTHCSSSYSGHESSVLCIKYSTCGTFIYSGGGDCTLRVWDVLTKTQMKVNKHHTHWVLCIDCNTDTVVSGDMSGTVCAYTVKGDFIQKYSIHKNSITSLILYKDRIYTSSRDKTAKISTLTGTILYSYTHTQPVTCVALNQYFFCSGSTDKSLKIYTHDFQHQKTFTHHKNRINSINLTNKFMLTTSDDHTAHLYQLDGLESVSNRLHGSNGVSDSNVINTPLENSKDTNTPLTTFPLITTSLITLPSSYITLQHNSIITTASISPNNNIIVTGSFDKKVKIWNTKGTLIYDYLHLDSIYKVHCTNTSIISASKDGIIKICSFYSKKVVNEFICKSEIYCFDLYESQLVCGCKDRKVYFFL